MKIEYLIHEYTWSNHCISGNKLGWGIVASSIPEDRTYLRELEKVAQAAVVDKTGRIEVEELVYLSLIHISEPTRPYRTSRMPSSA